MRKDLLPKHLQNIIIRGFEETEAEKAAREAKEAEDKNSEEDEDENDGGGDDKDKDNDGLKSALRKERLERKRLDKEARELRKFKEEQESKEKSESDKAKDEASKAVSQAQKLAEKLKEAAVDNAITKLATKLKFRDIDDALKLVDRGEIEVEQDEDDPSEIELDEKSVEAALEKLKKAKPHLIAVADGQEDRSGSRFNGKPKSNKDADEEALRSKYPALNRSAHTS